MASPFQAPSTLRPMTTPSLRHDHHRTLSAERQRIRRHSSLPSLTQQDCIEWDESRNVDLRKIASPHFKTPRESWLETPSSSENGADRSGSRTSDSSCLTSKGVAREGRRRRSSLRALGARAPPSRNTELEIDDLLNRLAREEELEKAQRLTNNNTDTPRLKNMGPSPPPPPLRHLGWMGVAGSRKRQRRALFPRPAQNNPLNGQLLPSKFAKENVVNSSRATGTGPQVSGAAGRGQNSQDGSKAINSPLSPVPESNPPADFVLSGSSDFEDLLLQVQSPPPQLLRSAPPAPSRIPPPSNGITPLQPRHPNLPRQTNVLVEKPEMVTPATGAAPLPPPRLPLHAGTAVVDPFFDDLPDFSLEDLESLDHIEKIALSQRGLSEGPSGETTASSEVAPPEPRDLAGTRPQVPSTEQDVFAAAKPPSAATDLLFDDDQLFAELDWDEFDRATASRQANSQSHCPSPATLEHQAIRRDLGQLASAPPVTCVDGLVRNTQAEVQKSTTNFLTFSRYKIVRVVEEPQRTFSKTLSVAAWKEEMLSRSDESKALHRRGIQGEPKDWPVDGVVYLCGEWYHTNVVPGDVIHICSLSGRYRTDTAALPLTLHTSPPDGSDLHDDLLLIVHPDILLTPTAISDTVSCTRRAVLRNRLGSSGFAEKAPLFGIMRHQLFEETMKTKDFSPTSAVKSVQQIVRKNAEGLLSCAVTSREAETEVIKCLPQIQKFAKDFTAFTHRDDAKKRSPHQYSMLESHTTQPPSVRFLAQEVEGVEEPVISPELGLKGNLDMVVRAFSSPCVQTHDLSRSLVGIELKTSHHQRTQPAHMAQLALYIIMMQARYGSNSSCSPDVDAETFGMLLYLNNESLRAIHIQPLIGEIKSLIGQRNVLAIEQVRASRPRGVVLRYESEQDSSNKTPRVTLVDPPPVTLPELLNNPHTCEKCYLNRECMLFAATESASSARSGHTDLMSHFTGHLQPPDLDYFLAWDRLIDLEADFGSFSIAEPWLSKAASLGRRSFSSLIFDDLNSSRCKLADNLSASIISFQLPPSVKEFPMEKGSLVVISTDNTTFDRLVLENRRPQMHIVRGYLHLVTDRLIQVRGSVDDLDRVRKASCAGQVLFRLDRDEAPTGITTLRQNLVNFLTGNDSMHISQDRLQRKRDLIIRLSPPLFDRVSDQLMFAPSIGIPYVPGCDPEQLALEFSELNADQRAAVEMVVRMKDYTLIQGLPGTGKTSTVAFVTRLLASHGKRILISSYTHAAVDNLMMKLMDKGLAQRNDEMNAPALVRIGQKSFCHPKVLPVLVTTIASELENKSSTEPDDRYCPSAESLRASITSARIVGATALSVPKSPFLQDVHFDVVIIDEAGQISQPAILGALFAGSSFVLVGDHMQLPPLVSSELAEEGGYGVSLLKRLAEAHPHSLVPLTIQYRMHKDICQISSDLVYEGKLKCADGKVAEQRLHLPGFPQHVPETARWIHRLIDPLAAVMFSDTDKDGRCHSLESSSTNMVGGSLVNYTELNAVKSIVGSLIACGLEASSIAVISPFRAQVNLIAEDSETSRWKSEGLEISTIDRYQGRDKPAVIISFVRSNASAQVGRLLEDVRRLNVAMTRAKSKLILVGSYSTLYNGSFILRPVLDRIKRTGALVTVPEAVKQNSVAELS